MIIPYDFGTPTKQGGTVLGVLDRTIGALLEKIAKSKGDNIVSFKYTHLLSADPASVDCNF